MRTLIYILLVILTSCSGEQNANSFVFSNSQIKQNKEKENDILETNVCELLNSPDKFEQKLIKIKAIYRYGFEWSEIYSLKCKTQKRIWVENTNKQCKNAQEISKLETAGMGGKTVGVIAIGRFTGEKGKYGHMNNFDYLFKMECLDKAEILDNEGAIPQALTPDQKLKIEQFENPN